MENNRFKLIFVTGNLHKLDEIKKYLENVEVVGQKIDLPELQGDPEVIAKTKAKEASRIINGPIVIDDTCFHIEAFNGFPGPYARDHIKTIGNKITLKMLQNFDNRKAKFVCRATYCEPSNEPIIFEGTVEGKIAAEIRGKEGFGFDPIFIPENEDKTFGEMSVEEKNKFNHRARAFKKLADYLGQNNHNIFKQLP
ncbi:MAG TPA: RdgB/HAM1 family non-canonical purine NTP pyrophosphatase [Candidatus Nanoarchaeia archaeon]|nr:RdgB/HAM1 family non-canonical purine NTP pyrophosphatase [Candidatus Nanoarchaeia archaeon]